VGSLTGLVAQPTLPCLHAEKPQTTSGHASIDHFTFLYVSPFLQKKLTRYLPEIPVGPTFFVAMDRAQAMK
jgi:hypothetical protein